MTQRLPQVLATGFLILVAAGCDSRSERHAEVRVDGSSTVAPISMAAAEMYREKNSDVHVTVGISGTGGGFKKFLDVKPDLRTDINDASRPIKPVEIEKTQSVGLAFVEVPIALDGIAVVVNPGNAFCDHLTVAELRKIWEPGSTVRNWKDVREGFPDVPLKLYGPGTDSGTFDYFTEVVCGKEKASRSDFNMSEDDNVLVQGVNGDAGALGYFGFAYYEANAQKLKLLGIDPDTGTPVKPTMQTIRDGTYKPLSRPLLLYVNKAALDRPEVSGFLEFYLENAPRIVEHPKVRYVSLPAEVYDVARERLRRRVTGSVLAEIRHDQPLNLAELYGSR